MFIRYSQRGVLFLSVTLGALAAQASNRAVINEVRKLRNSLPLQDAQRSEVNLRLADMLAGSCLVMSSASAKERESDCKEAFSLYQGEVTKVSLTRQPKIRFQMARISLEQGELPKAHALFEEVLKGADDVELRRESAFRLAEIEEMNPATEKRAEARYRFVLEVCNGGDSCSFARYRIAWILKKQGNLPAAIEEMKLALLDSKGQYRTESVRDLVMFMGQDVRDAQGHIQFIENLSAKMGQPKVLEDLAFAYLTGVNKLAGVQVLEVINARSPSIVRELKLLEEIYGLRDWERMNLHLASLTTLAKDASQIASMGDTLELEKIAKRLAIQLDGERVGNAARAQEYKTFALIVLDLFPKSKDIAKVMEGWVAAESDPQAQLAKLGEWTRSTAFTLSANDKIHLHELRAGIAQKQKEHALVIEEMNALMAMNPTPVKALEYRYALAKAHYELKDFGKALPLFQALSAEALNAGGAGVSTLQIQAQQLALDILNQQKDFAGIQKQASLWTQNSALSKQPKIAADINEMQVISDQAAFEAAVLLKETPEALTQFKSFCEASKFLPKSCDNAKAISLKLGKQEDLIAVLRVQYSQTKNTERGAELASELATELELGGFFVESAKVQEELLARQAKGSSLVNWLKLAMTYELGSDLKARDRVLQSLQKKNFSPAASEAEQLALADALADAQLLNATWLARTGFSKAYQIRVADRLEGMGRGTPATNQLVLSQTNPSGPAWKNVVLKEAVRLDQVQSKIAFYGRNGEQKFKSRIAGLKQLNDFVGRMLPASDAETRVILLKLSKTATEAMVKEILESPLPETLTADQKAAVQQSLTELAQPFVQLASNSERLTKEELSKEHPQELQSKLKELETAEIAKIVEERKLAILPAPQVVDASTVEPVVAKLKQDPKNSVTLESLRDIYRRSKQDRLASYYENRISQVKGEASAK